MAKEAYYFSHDSNARNDEKIIALRMKHGMEGYGIYFSILERMRDLNDYIHVKDYNIIAFDLRVSNTLIKSVVEDFGLFEFTDDGKHFYSVSFLSRMKRKDVVSEKRREAGKLGAKSKIVANAKQMPEKNQANAKQMPEKNQARKGKEIERKEKESETPSREIDFASEIFSISELRNLSGEYWLETVGMKLNVAPDELSRFFDEFCNIHELSNYSNSINDFKSHFVNWLNVKKEKNRGKKEKSDESKIEHNYNAALEAIEILNREKT
jgi:hypothetical protein